VPGGRLREELGPRERGAEALREGAVVRRRDPEDGGVVVETRELAEGLGERGQLRGHRAVALEVRRVGGDEAVGDGGERYRRRRGHRNAVGGRRDGR
jgi:hypothetical protein